MKSLNGVVFQYLHINLRNITFTGKDIEKVTQNLESKKKVMITKLRQIIYKQCLSKGCFPDECKKANDGPAHKKNDKQLLKNYRTISLLPICGKNLERLTYYTVFEFFIYNNLTAPYQSGFKTGDSYIN